MKHINFLTVVAVCLLSAFTAKAQSRKTDSVKIRKAQSINFEFGSVGLFYSVNYDTRFNQQRGGWGARLGVGYWHYQGQDVIAGKLSNTITKTTFITVPFQINYLIGKRRSFLELGAGATLMALNGTYGGNPLLGIDEHPVSTTVLPTTTIGYRYQPLKHGVNFRISFNPVMLDGTVLPYFGLGVGYTFR